MRPAALRLSELLGSPVVFATDVVGPDAQAKAASLKDGQVLLVENLRFDKREKKNDPGILRRACQARRGLRERRVRHRSSRACLHGWRC